MRKRFPRLVTCIVMCALAVAILPSNADDQAAQDKVQLVTVVYQVPDLPLYQQNSNEFKPDVLIALMKSACEDFDKLNGGIAQHETTHSLVVPKSWESGKSLIGVHDATRSLVIRTTRDNQQKIANLLGELRGNPATDKPEQRKQSLKHDRVRSEVCEVPPTVLPSNDKGSKRVGVGERASYHSIDPEWNQLKQYIDSPHRQPIDLPADVEMLVKRLTISTPEHSWPSWEEAELPYLPTIWPGLHLRSR